MRMDRRDEEEMGPVNPGFVPFNHMLHSQVQCEAHLGLSALLFAELEFVLTTKVLTSSTSSSPQAAKSAMGLELKRPGKYLLT